MDMNFSSFRENLATLIEGRGLTYVSLGAELNMSPATFSRYINDTNKIPSMDYVVRLAEYFGVSVDWLVGYSGGKTDMLPTEIQNLINAYNKATPGDKNVVWAILGKYQEDKQNETEQIDK